MCNRTYLSHKTATLHSEKELVVPTGWILVAGLMWFTENNSLEQFHPKTAFCLKYHTFYLHAQPVAFLLLFAEQVLHSTLKILWRRHERNRQPWWGIPSQDICTSVHKVILETLRRFWLNWKQSLPTSLNLISTGSEITWIALRCNFITNTGKVNRQDICTVSQTLFTIATFWCNPHTWKGS